MEAFFYPSNPDISSHIFQTVLFLFLWYWQKEFVLQSASKIDGHFLYSRDLYTWIKGDTKKGKIRGQSFEEVIGLSPIQSEWYWALLKEMGTLTHKCIN